MANQYKLGDGLKKLGLAGIGAAAVTYEKSSELIDKLAKKGESTVEQGKELNQELKHNAKQTFESRKTRPDGSEDIAAKLASMSMDELDALKEKITKTQQKIRDAVSPDADTAGKEDQVVDGTAEDVSATDETADSARATESEAEDTHTGSEEAQE